MASDEISTVKARKASNRVLEVSRYQPKPSVRFWAIYAGPQWHLGGPVRDTSLSAYAELRATGKLTAGQRRVMIWFHSQPPDSRFTRAQIAQRTGLPLQTVCGRCRELLDLGYLQELAAVRCPVTGNPSHQLRVAPPQETPAQVAVAVEDELLITTYHSKTGLPFQYVAVKSCA